MDPAICTSDTFIYDDMDSQSGRSLPLIYQPFDADRRSHWRDRGALFDFLFATCGEEGRLLDFGPGDGWPSLIVAPYVREVVGVDASRRRVEICRENAARLALDDITVERLSGALSTIVDARMCTTIHPSARTWMAWLEDAGFREVIPSHSGSRMAGELFDRLPRDQRPRTIEAVDDYLRPIVGVAVHMPAPVDSEPMLTAIK